MKSNPVIFYLNNKYIEYYPETPYLSVLDFLRLDKELTGTKEGCGEGDCGACTVLLGSLKKGKSGFEVKYESINSCIKFLPTVHGCHLISIENLSEDGQLLHPIQQEMKKSNGVQCGFCTPGIVMSMYNLFLNHTSADKNKIEQYLQGNLCRCTGYSPIVNATKKVLEKYSKDKDSLFISSKKMKTKLLKIKRKSSFPSAVPENLTALKNIIKANKTFTILSGTTDVGVSVNRDMMHPPNPIFISQIEELKYIKYRKNFISVGSSVTYSELIKELKNIYPDIATYLIRIGGEQIRNMGTIGGNIATASPIGDMLPPLIALQAKLVLIDCDSNKRTIPIENFFVKYRVTTLKKNEFISSVQIPYPKIGSIFSNHKISKRRDEDISSVCASFYLVLKKSCVEDIKLVFGGMDEIPKRAKCTESFLMGKPWNQEEVLKASDKLSKDFSPISDARASRVYRTLIAKNLFKKFYVEKFEGHEGLTRNGQLLR